MNVYFLWYVTKYIEFQNKCKSARNVSYQWREVSHMLEFKDISDVLLLTTSLR